MGSIEKVNLSPIRTNGAVRCAPHSQRTLQFLVRSAIDRTCSPIPAGNVRVSAEVYEKFGT